MTPKQDMIFRRIVALTPLGWFAIGMIWVLTEYSLRDSIKEWVR